MIFTPCELNFGLLPLAAFFLAFLDFLPASAAMAAMLESSFSVNYFFKSDRLFEKAHQNLKMFLQQLHHEVDGSGRVRRLK